MKRSDLLCRTATTFGNNGIGLDEEAFRQHLQRLIGAGLGVYVGSAGSGESHAMTRDELATIYRIAVQEGKGKVAVNANPPEQHTAALTLEAFAAGREGRRRGRQHIRAFQLAWFHANGR